MQWIYRTFLDFQGIQKHILSRIPTLYLSSKTSTVIPYSQLEEFLAKKNPPPNSQDSFCIADLSQLPAKMTLLESGNLWIEGGVHWKDAIAFCQSHGRNIQVSPTEELALICAGVATSATGERSFAYGSIRNQIQSLQYIDHEGEVQKLSSLKPLPLAIENRPLFMEYAENYNPYKNFKNGPFPRFETETDLLIGTEGQLGVITGVELTTEPLQPVKYLFLLLPSWEETLEPHLEVFFKIQAFRNIVYSAELVDSNSLRNCPLKEKAGNGEEDVLFLEIKSEHFETFYQNFILELKSVTDSQIFEIDANRYHLLRKSVPRSIQELNTRHKVLKKGTDIQVAPHQFQNLLEFYQQAQTLKIPYCLFGHFGDAHLHFNFLADPNDAPICDRYLTDLYQTVFQWKGSPFAEHGIGLLKQSLVAPYHQKTQQSVFHTLKKRYDPYRQFFPQGFMNC